jgi:phosphate transport system permease protein
MDGIPMKSGKTLQLRLLQDSIFKVGIAILSTMLMVPLLFILYYIISQGISAFSWDFLTHLPKPVGEVGGGVSNAIVGTLILVTLAGLMSIPLGIFIAIYLSENRGQKLAYYVRICSDTLQGIPSIVMGIIAYAWIVIPMGGFSAFSGSVALALMMLPMVTKSTEETLKMIPDSIKEAAFALGAPYYKTMLKIVLPSAKSGILSGILLGLARIMGETAPLLFTAFGNPFMALNILKPVNSLPLLIFNYATSPYDDWQQLAWGASLLLIIFILVLSLLAKVIAKK